jgi:hypothetical protein
MARAAEVAVLAYVLSPGRYFELGGSNAPLVHAALVGGVFYGYNEYVSKMFK